jgi:hypothetical protein
VGLTDCLQGSFEAFCDKVAALAAEREKASKLKTFQSLKAELEADGLLAKVEGQE